MGLWKTDGTFEEFEWLGLISWPDNRNGVLFPAKIGGKYWRMDRPNVDRALDIWTGQSPDLIHWGVPRCIVRMGDVHWAYNKIGPGAVPIRTSEGWLCIIHAVRVQCTDLVYQLGCMLLDLENPNQVIGVSKRAILWPETTYELDRPIAQRGLHLRGHPGGRRHRPHLLRSGRHRPMPGHRHVEDLIYACKNE